MDLPLPLKRAKKVSVLAQHDTHQIGATIFLKGIPLSFGFNQQFKTHPKMKQYDEHKTIHAELAAILKVKDKSKLRGATMYVFRETKDGKYANSRPCHVCQALMREYRFKNFVYTIDNTWREETIVYDEGQ